MKPVVAWKTTLGELEHQMTKATFNQWLKGCELVSSDGDVWVVTVRNDYAADWIAHRLDETIRRTASTIFGREITLEYKTAAAVERPPRSLFSESELETPVKPAPGPDDHFPGFEPIRSNFVRVPRQFFEVILTGEPDIVKSFVLAVCFNTRGVIVDWSTGATLKWWKATNEEAAAASGFDLRQAYIAIPLSRRSGYVIRGGKPRGYKYRLRETGENIIWTPDDEAQIQKNKAAARYL